MINIHILAQASNAKCHIENLQIKQEYHNKIFEEMVIFVQCSVHSVCFETYRATLTDVPYSNIQLLIFMLPSLHHPPSICLQAPPL